MQRFLGRYAEIAYTLLRVVAGLMFAVHGAQKLFGFLGGHQMPIGSLVRLRRAHRVRRRPAHRHRAPHQLGGFIASGEMAVAYFMFHAKDGFWPILNKGELAVLYCFVFLYIACRGGGRYSVGRGSTA